MSWGNDPDTADKSSIDYGPPPGKKPKEIDPARSSGDAGTRAGGRNGELSRPPKLHPTSRSSSGAREGSSQRKGDSSGSRNPARRRPPTTPSPPVLPVQSKRRASTPVKESKPERYHYGSDDDVKDRDKFLLIEAREEIREMERQAQQLILEQQQAFKHQQHVTELQAYLAMERQQQDTERQLTAHVREAQQEEATMKEN